MWQISTAIGQGSSEISRWKKMMTMMMKRQPIIMLLTHSRPRT